MSKFRVVLNAWLLALILFCIVAVPIFAAYSDCAYYITVTVSNNSSTSYPNLRVVYDVNPASLVAGGYMQVDADDVYLTSSSSVLYSTALNMTGDGVHWLGVVNAPAHSNQQLRLYTGWVAAAGRNQPWLAASGDVGTVADSASLEVPIDLTVSANLTVPAAPTGTNTIINRAGEYRMSVNATSYIFGVSKPGTAYTYGMVPTGAGFATDIASVVPAGLAHWAAVGDSGNDTSYVYTTAADQSDYYTLSAFSLPAGYTISSLDIVARCKNPGAGTSNVYGFFRLGSTDGAASSTTITSTSFGNKTLTAVARPGGGNWTSTDLVSLQVGLRLQWVTTSAWCSEVQVVVNYKAPTETSVSSAITPSATSHNVKGSYNGTAVDLYVDGVRTATTALVGTLAYGTNSTVSVLGFDGLIDDLRVGSGSVVTPTWVATYQFEAAQVNSGQIMDQSGNGNTITYTLAGMPANTGTAVGSLTPITLYISTSVGGNTSASEPQVIPPFNIPLYENTTATGSNLLGYDLFVRGANSLGWSSATLYSVMFMEAAIAFGFAATIGTGTLFFGALAGMGLLTLGAATGLLAWWIPLILGLLVAMGITVFREL